MTDAPERCGPPVVGAVGVIPGRKPGAGLRGRLQGLVTGVLGMVLLAAAIVSTFTAGRDAALADLDSGLNSQAAGRASVLKEYFERAESINLLLANDSVFKAVEPGRGQLSGQQFAVASAQAGKAVAYLEQLYHGRISLDPPVKFVSVAGRNGRIPF